MKIKAIDILIAFLMLCILYALGLLCVGIARKSAGITEIPWDLGLRSVTEAAPPEKVETPEETLHNRLSAQSEQLNELLTADIPQARKALSGDMDKIDADIVSTTNETTLAQLRTELRSIAHKQLVLESLEKDAPEALIRIRSMLRMLEQDARMPAGIMEDFENSFKFVSQLANGDFYTSLEKVDIDPGMVETRTEELWNAAGQKRIEEQKLTEQRKIAEAALLKQKEEAELRRKAAAQLEAALRKQKEEIEAAQRKITRRKQEEAAAEHERQLQIAEAKRAQEAELHRKAAAQLEATRQEELRKAAEAEAQKAFQARAQAEESLLESALRMHEETAEEYERQRQISEATAEKIRGNGAMLTKMNQELLEWEKQLERIRRRRANKPYPSMEDHEKKPAVVSSGKLSKKTFRRIMSGEGVRIINNVPNTKLTDVTVSIGNEVFPLVEENGVWRVKETEQ